MRQASRRNTMTSSVHSSMMLNDRMDSFLPSIVERLDTTLLLPHDHVLTQGSNGTAASFYYIGKGNCKVTVKNKRGKEVVVRTLLQGEHFGEISLIYNCDRTATVISMNYNTFAVMKHHLYKRLVQDYPEYEACLKRYVVAEYCDHRIKFLLAMVKRIEYFDKAPLDIMFDLIFSMKTVIFNKEQMVLTQDQTIDSIYFIEEGKVLVETEFEGNQFVLDKLGPGSIINYRAVFLKDQMFVNMKALTEVKVLVMSLDTLIGLVTKHSEPQKKDLSEKAVIAHRERMQSFATRVLIAQNRLLKAEKTYPVDYLRKDLKDDEDQAYQDAIYRRNLLKNVVMRIVVEIWERKKRPKLGDVMKVYRSKKHEPNAKEQF